MPTRTYSSDEITKLKQLITEGVQVNQELDALKEGLRETVKAVAEELDIKPALINKAIKSKLVLKMFEDIIGSPGNN